MSCSQVQVPLVLLRYQSAVWEEPAPVDGVTASARSQVLSPVWDIPEESGTVRDEERLSLLGVEQGAPEG